MSEAVAERDPGPMARLRALQADPGSVQEILNALQDGETFPSLAKRWGLPKKEFLSAIAANAELTAHCRRVIELAGIWMRMEGLEIVDEATVEGAAVAKLQADYRERLSRDLNRPLFGKFTQHEHSHTVDLGEVLRRAKEREVLGDEITQAPEAVRLGTESPPLALPALVSEYPPGKEPL